MAEEKPIFEFVKAAQDAELQKGRKVGIPATAAGCPYLGYYVCVGPADPPAIEESTNTQVEINFTGPPGTASGLYYSLAFQLLRWDWNVVKVDEWIEVSPTHREYYERTAATKAGIETAIKQGLGSAAQAVGEFELVKHDFRKYKEIADYFDAIERARAEKDTAKRKEKIAAAEHALKAMFIDQVDVHNGATSIIQMVGSRWPNLIADFMQLTEEDDTVKKIADRLKISHAEAVVLQTKNVLFREWLKLFKDAVKERYEMLYNLMVSREKSVEEYREWIKPHIARYKMIKLGAERAGTRLGALKSFADLTGQSTFTNAIRVYAWKPFRAVEHRKAPWVAKKGEFVADPWDDFVREKIVLDRNYGLASRDFYPWLLNPSVDPGFLKKAGLKEKLGSMEEAFEKKATVADEIVNKIKSKWTTEMRLDKSEFYYTFLDFNILRVGTRLPNAELEDITFLTKMWILSQNILLAKLIEMECRERELDRYIDQILGMKTVKGEEVSEVVKRDFPHLFGEKPKEEKNLFAGLKEFGEKLGKPFGGVEFKPKLGKLAPYLVRPGPYENNFQDRITKLYIVPAGRIWINVNTFLLGKMGVE